MIKFILALYIIGANGFVIPAAVWTVAWVACGLAGLGALIKIIGKSK